jgi:Fe-S-cluster-containing dehydrogenase component
MFVFQKDRCTGCGACVVACMDRNGTDLSRTPPNRRLRRQEGLQNGTPYVQFAMLACRHCAEPQCVAACPTAAMHREGPWVRVDAAACVACGQCAARCPFDAIVLTADGPVKCPGCPDRVCVTACPTHAWGKKI